MSKKLNIEQLISSRLSEAEITPQKVSWNTVYRRLRWRKFLQFKPWQLNIYTIGGILLISTSSLLIMNRTREVPNSDIKINVPGLPTNEGLATKEESHEKYMEYKGTFVHEEKLENAAHDSEQKPVPEVEQTQPVSNPAGKADSLYLHKLAEIDPVEELKNADTQTVVYPPRPYFIPSIQAGCPPLEVKFINQSEHAISFKWLFDEAGVSTERDPSFTFRDAGQYRVTLIAVNKGGWSKRYVHEITVYEAPTAEFYFREPLDQLEGKKGLELVNQSSNAFAFNWSIPGSMESWTSSEFEPRLKSTDIERNKGVIQLEAISEMGCLDTMTLSVPVDQLYHTPTLQFPTAFSPNETGAIGGNYSPNEKRTDIFHPVFVEAPAEYKLKIYTRRGELVFETDNIYFGWDGYYLQERSASDVYVWMVEGRWSDGREFKFRGDVTLLWNGHM